MWDVKVHNHLLLDMMMTMVVHDRWNVHNLFLCHRDWRFSYVLALSMDSLFLLDDLGHVNNLFLRHWDWHSNNLLNHLLYDSLLRNHLGYVHDLLHLMRNKDVNI